MTIPIQPVNIRPEFVQGQSGWEQFGKNFDVINLAIQHRVELEQARQQLIQDREKFELNKKLVGSQIAGMDLEQEKTKRGFAQQDADIAARGRALTLYTGNLPMMHDMESWGRIFAEEKDPLVTQHLMEYITEGITTRTKAAELEQTTLENRKSINALNTDSLTRSILQRYGTQLTTDRGQQRAIAEIAANAGPDAANSVASAFNVGSGRYHNWVGQDGYMWIIDTKNGGVRKGEFTGTRAAQQVDQEAKRRAAGTIVDLLDEQSVIARGGIGGTKNPSLAEATEGSRVLGIPLEAFSNLFRSNPQEVTRLLRTRFAHNYVGLLSHSRSAANLLKNLTESYWAPGGSSKETLLRAEADRQKLRAIMVDVRDGKITDWSRIPGYAASVAAAAAEANEAPPVDPNAPAPNLQDWRQGVPPP